MKDLSESEKKDLFKKMIQEFHNHLDTREMEKMPRFSCWECKSKLVEVEDSIAKKKTGYLWTCPKGCMGKAVLCIG